ncbi:hypothetical protein Q8791_23150 [Nocardiopsis sp. CT-R113]|uniref:Uncharacterized protein n=1 Tax=Nocardiopsis codii TaxID=3065942 RepID=A0ABU7KD13_9ACTN|nr:hypothetical protein [Nocardiopsis sp. CT-R113]MEE2040119.1 hypothetical protein [Nocardiopsis sp. CT-R113]
MPARTHTRPRHSRSGRVTRTAFTHCLACGKLAFSCRRHAKRAARTGFPNDRMSVYRCRELDGQGWHFGHSTWWRWERDHLNAA